MYTDTERTMNTQKIRYPVDKYWKKIYFKKFPIKKSFLFSHREVSCNRVLLNKRISDRNVISTNLNEEDGKYYNKIDAHADYWKVSLQESETKLEWDAAIFEQNYNWW